MVAVACFCEVVLVPDDWDRTGSFDVGGHCNLRTKKRYFPRDERSPKKPQPFPQFFLFAPHPCFCSRGGCIFLLKSVARFWILAILVILVPCACAQRVVNENKNARDDPHPQAILCRFVSHTKLFCLRDLFLLSRQALERTHALGNSRAIEIFVHEQLNLHRGQGREILWRDSNRCPTEEEYESMVLDSECALAGLCLGGRGTTGHIAPQQHV